MKFTDKFTLITVTVVLCCMGLMFAGGLFSLRALSQAHHQQKLQEVLNVIDVQLGTPKGKRYFDIWLPDLLNATGILSLEVKEGEKGNFKEFYKNLHNYPEKKLVHFEYQLEKTPDVTIRFRTRRPFDQLDFSFMPLLGIALASLLSFIFLFVSLRWIKSQFKGAELLEKRAKYILQGNPTASVAQKGEWPKLASQALDALALKLEGTRDDIGSFDERMRGQVFVDRTTGLGNHLAFNNHLEVLSLDLSVLSSGLFIIEFDELYSLKAEQGTQAYQAMLLQIAEVLTAFCVPFHDQFHGRIERSVFAIILPQLSYDETIAITKKLSNRLFKIQLPDGFEVDSFFNMGVNCFSAGDKVEDIIETGYIALTTASHLTSTAWHIADQDKTHHGLVKGTVKWRGLLDNVLDNDTLFLYQQQVMKEGGKEQLYTEFFPRIKGFDGEVLVPGIFLVMAERCGLQKCFDRVVIEKVIAILSAKENETLSASINLSAELLSDRKRQQGLIYELMQLPNELRSRLVIEIAELSIANDTGILRKGIIALKKVGCQIAIDHVGKTVVNTKYITDLNIDYLKLHVGLVRDIHLNSVNQIAVQSLIASCLNSNARIIAVGVETKDEWKMLLKLGVVAGQGHLFGKPLPVL
jgi:RNase E specificity factor CsrD